MSFEYPWTCPDIDRAISKIKSEIESRISDVLTDASPLLEYAHRNKLASEYAESIYDDIEDHIEAIRTTNEKLRAAAEKQVDALEEQISSLQELLHCYERAE